MPNITHSQSPPTKYQIALAETVLKTQFSENLKNYLERYGYIETDDVTFYGMTRQMGIQSNLIILTKKLRNDHPDIPENSVLIESPGENRYALVDINDSVWLYQPEQPPKLANMNLTEYIHARINPL